MKMTCKSKILLKSMADLLTPLLHEVLLMYNSSTANRKSTRKRNYAICVVKNLAGYVTSTDSRLFIHYMQNLCTKRSEIKGHLLSNI